MHEEQNNGYVITDQKGNRVEVGRGGITPPAATLFLQQASGQIYEDDVDVFTSE